MTTENPGGETVPNFAGDELAYTAHEMKRETNWVGAFVIGLAGTILVTGIAPVMVTTLGAACIPVTVVITLTGWLLCLFWAELAAMMPERTGGAPSYAYPAFKARWPKLAKHINGVIAWMYWLGWFPVGPLNMIPASFYLAALFGLNTTAGNNPLGTPIAYWTLGISIVGGTRNAAKRINAEAMRLGCSAIVMGADAPKHWLVMDFFWSQEPHRVT